MRGGKSLRVRIRIHCLAAPETSRSICRAGRIPTHARQPDLLVFGRLSGTAGLADFELGGCRAPVGELLMLGMGWGTRGRAGENLPVAEDATGYRSEGRSSISAWACYYVFYSGHHDLGAGA